MPIALGYFVVEIEVVRIVYIDQVAYSLSDIYHRALLFQGYLR